MRNELAIKVCGGTSLAQLEQLAAAGADYVGMIFYPKSDRYAGHLEPDANAIGSLPVKKTGVFVNAAAETVKEAIALFQLDAVQLHGDETPDYCEELKGLAALVKAFRISGHEDIDSLTSSYQGAVDYFLFDTATPRYGGSGVAFNWALLEKARIGKPFFLSGGIGPDHLPRIRSFSHPYLYALDINSRFETSPGVKDIRLVQSFIQQVKNLSTI